MAGLYLFVLASVLSCVVGLIFRSHYQQISTSVEDVDSKARPGYIVFAGALGFANIALFLIEGDWPVFSFLLSPVVSATNAIVCVLFSFSVMPRRDRKRNSGFLLAGLWIVSAALIFTI